MSPAPSSATRGWVVTFAGLVMGLGIGAMHYVGMAALRSSAAFAYRPWLVLLSFVIAVALSTGALVAVDRATGKTGRMIAALVLGGAVVGMHYTALSATRLLPGVDMGAQGGVGSLGLAGRFHELEGLRAADDLQEGSVGGPGGQPDLLGQRGAPDFHHR